MGNKAADMAVQIMVGTQVSQMPVHFFDSWQAWINQAALESFEGELPEDLLSTANYVVRKGEAA